mmetsp:Transcript_25926/g.29856  ORF Transcript_25926/g.29856 Transcript_25926/m.29856 type:complete len:98 (+) Transcript_25926:472-765(+)
MIAKQRNVLYSLGKHNVQLIDRKLKLSLACIYYSNGNKWTNTVIFQFIYCYQYLNMYKRIDVVMGNINFLNYSLITGESYSLDISLLAMANSMVVKK